MQITLPISLRFTPKPGVDPNYIRYHMPPKPPKTFVFDDESLFLSALGKVFEFEGHKFKVVELRTEYTASEDQFYQFYASIVVEYICPI